MPTGLWTDRNNYASSFAGGSGTASDPFLISTPAQLARIAATGYNSGYYYKLTADLDMSAHYWSPIGTSDSGINGCHCYFDGDGHTIQGLYFQYISGVSRYGLFRHLKQGYIKNLTVDSADFSALISRTSSTVYYCGALAGGTGYEDVYVGLRENMDTGDEYMCAYLAGGAIPTVTNCHVKNSTIGGGSSNGGLIGQAFGLDCLSCGVSDSTIKTGYCGGLIGEALLDGLPSAISHTDEAWHCIDSASVENVTLMPTKSCGGLIGFMEYSYLWTTTNYDNGIGEDSFYEWSGFAIDYCTIENLVCDMSNMSGSREASGLIGAVSSYIGDMGSLNPSYEWMTGIAQINIDHTAIKSMTCIDPKQTCYFSIAIPDDVGLLQSYTAGQNGTNRYSVFSENETTYTDRKAYAKNITYQDGETEIKPFVTGVSTHERCSNNHIVFDFVTGQQNYYMKSSSALVEGELYYMNSNGNIVAVTDRGYKNDSGAII